MYGKVYLMCTSDDQGGGFEIRMMKEGMEVLLVRKKGTPHQYAL